MRFRKSIRIMKGVRVNFSKSGLSLTAGVKGASINMGSRGTYLNTGIPGTGLYDRKRIGNSPTVGTSYSSSTSSSIDLSITVGIDDNGNYYIKDQNGQIITDESLLRKIKRTDVYKNKIIELSDKFANDKNLETEEFVEIYKLSEKIINEAEINLKLSNLTPQKYIKQAYPIPKPDENTIRVNVEDEAKKKIKSLVFWTLKKRRQEYFNNEFPIQFKKEIEKYEIALQEHNNNELRIEIGKNKEYEYLYIMEKKLLEDILVGKKEFVESSLDSFLQSMTLPINFEVSYEYDEDNGNLKVDLDLPEIEDLPTSKATKLSSGKIKVKDKTQKEIKEEYIICVTGLAFFFSSYFFNISTHIEKVLISGFTQRISKKTGQMNDEYVYSIVFTRNDFQKIEIAKIVPYLAFESFKFRMSYSKTFELTTIEPISDLVKET